MARYIACVSKGGGGGQEGWVMGVTDYIHSILKLNSW